MFKYLPLLLATTATAEVKYNLPIEYACNGQTRQAIGAAICAQSDYPSYLKVKIPPTKGQLRVMDCNEDLTRNKRPNDFNTQIERQGWWIFARNVITLSGTPKFELPRRSYDNCAIVASVGAEKTGVQTAVLIYDSRMKGAFAEMACAAEPNFVPVDKVGLCRALDGARLAFRTNKKEGEFHIIGSGCGIQDKRDLPSTESISLKVPSGQCVIDLLWKNGDYSERSRVLVIGDNRTSRELDTPLMVRDGDGVRVYKPLGAAVISTEIYRGNEVLWRSGSRDDESYTLSPGDDGPKPWPSDGAMCHTAYSDVLQSSSQVCYNLGSMVEMPTYLFQ